MASLQCCVELYPRKRHLLHTISFMSVPDCPCSLSIGCPPTTITLTLTLLHIIPSPSVYCLKSHRANWDRASSGAEETWSHRSGNWTLLPLSAVSSPSLSSTFTCVCSSPLSPPLLSSSCASQLSNVLFTHSESVRNTARRNTAARVREGRT